MGSHRIGGLFFGYGGLDQAVQEVLGGDLAWVSEIDKGACKIINRRYPNVPNLGDITAVDWATVEPVDIITGGSPCQDLSHAGKRGGMTEGTRSNLWVSMREAIAQLRPSLVVWENVRGAYSACADSDMGLCPRCVDPAYPGGHAPVLRALGRVLGDLSELGYVGGWHGLRAADVGAPHGRFRVFVVAHAADNGPQIQRITGRPQPTLTSNLSGGTHLLPTPTSSDTNGAGAHRDGGVDIGTAVSLLPTPAVNDMGEGKTPEAWDEWTAKMQAAHGNGNGHGKSLSIEAQRLLPTPVTSYSQRSPEDWRAGRPAGNGQARDAIGDLEIVAKMHADEQNWGIYADAIARWEQVLGRPAPPPTQPSKKGTPQLSPAFSEWLMGLPDGWVTDVPGITRNEALKALGNGVVPQQAAAALRFLLGGGEMPAVTPPPPTLLATPRSQHGEERNSNIWARPLDQPQNLENQLARLPGTDGAA